MKSKILFVISTKTQYKKKWGRRVENCERKRLVKNGE